MLTNHNMMPGALPPWYPNAAREVGRMHVHEMINAEDYAIHMLLIRCVASAQSKRLYHHKRSVEAKGQRQWRS